MKENNPNNKKNGYIGLGIIVVLACIVVFGSGPLYKIIDDRARPDIYTPGTYTGSAKGYGGTVTSKVTVTTKTIEAIDVTGEKETLLNLVLPGLTDEIKAKQSTEVDGVSGATLSSNAIKEGVYQALAQARGESVPTEVEETETTEKVETIETTKTDSESPDVYTPGTYTGSAKGYGGTVTTKVTVTAKKIESIEVNGEKETHLDKVLPDLTDAIIEKQSPEVDSVSGATLSSNAIKEGVYQALTQARGKAETTESKNYTSGSYTGSAKGYGGTVTVEVKVSENAIEAIEVKGEKESKLGDVIPGLTDAIIEKQSAEVDSVSGATLTSNAIKEAVNQALAQARGES